MKRQIRVIGFDDAPFERHAKDRVVVIGTFYRGGDIVDGIIFTHVENDGDDATQVIAAVVNKSRFRHHLRAILLDGIAFAGFNIVDIHSLFKMTGIPVIVVMRKTPDVAGMKHILARIGMHHKITLLENAGVIHDIGNIKLQLAGISLDDARELMRICSTRSNIPEALRLSHLIGHALVKGESRGRA